MFDIKFIILSSAFVILNFIGESYSLIDNDTPRLSDDKLRIENVSTDLKEPTSLAFLNSNDFLVLEKNNGTVQRIINGTISLKPVLDVNVNGEEERGMLGIAVSKNNSASSNKTFVFLYYTEAKDKDGGEPIGNRLYRYELVNDKLINPKLLLDLPYKPGPDHNGGVIAVGPDNNIYVGIGELISTSYNKSDYKFLSQNIQNGHNPDGRGGILRVTQEGKPVGGHSILGDEDPIKYYYAYGIRNIFGLAFDPISGNLWDTENGPRFGDEINLVEAGFNSGWIKVLGIWKVNETINKEDGKREISKGDVFDVNSNGLVDFKQRGKYSPPELTWNKSIGPTAITFQSSESLGTKYLDEIFVADTRGHIYRFDLNENRTALILEGPLADRVVDNASESQGSVFAKLPHIITDLDVGPDGYLYVTAYDKGAVFRIVPIQDTVPILQR